MIGPDGQPWAKHQGGFWFAEDETYTMLWTDWPCRVHFETPDKRSADFGPFELIQIADGMIRAGNNPPQVVAQLIDAMATWVLNADGTFWKSVVFSPP